MRQENLEREKHLEAEHEREEKRLEREVKRKNGFYKRQKRSV